eukprot:5296829-Prymnesium_polylepis.1
MPANSSIVGKTSMSCPQHDATPRSSPAAMQARPRGRVPAGTHLDGRGLNDASRRAAAQPRRAA